MKRLRDLRWWAWLLTAFALGAHLAGRPHALAVAMTLVALQASYLGWRARSLTAFPVQVRVAFLGLLLLGSWPALTFIHFVQVVGVASLLCFDYCLLGRCLSLLPGNRRDPLTRARLRATFLSSPVAGSIVAALESDRPPVL